MRDHRLHDGVRIDITHAAGVECMRRATLNCGPLDHGDWNVVADEGQNVSGVRQCFRYIVFGDAADAVHFRLSADPSWFAAS